MTPAAHTRNGTELLCKAGLHQLDEAIDSSLLVCAISDDADGGAAHDAQRQNAQKALSVHAALFLLDPCLLYTSDAADE